MTLGRQSKMRMRDARAVYVTARENGRTGLDGRYASLILQACAAKFHATQAALIRADTGPKDSLIGVEQESSARL